MWLVLLSSAAIGLNSPILATCQAHRLLTEMYCTWDDRIQRKRTFMVSVPDPHSWSSGFDCRIGDVPASGVVSSPSSGKCWNNVTKLATNGPFSSSQFSNEVLCRPDPCEHDTQGGTLENLRRGCTKRSRGPSTKHLCCTAVCMLGDFSSKPFHDNVSVLCNLFRMFTII